MMEAKDWMSFFVGLAVACAGVFPLLKNFGMGPSWFALDFIQVSIFSYIAAVAGFYLMVNSVIEITNSNAIGWISFLIALSFLTVGLLQALHGFGILKADFFALTIVTPIVYRVIFTIEGLFLMIACFAMEL